MADHAFRWVTATRVALLGALLLIIPSEGYARQETTTILFVRHAEAADGENPGLSRRGRERAAALVHVLASVELDAVHSTPLNRTMQTARPTAQDHGLEIIVTEPTRTFAEDMAHTLRTDHAGETVLVVSHSNTVPAMINALGGGPLEDLPHEEYDALFVVTLRGEETHVLRLQYGRSTN